MSRPKENLIGKRFGRLTVVAEGPGYIEPKSKCHRPNWYCDCDCGTKNFLVLSGNLRRGNSKSCGCLGKENASKTNRKYNTYDLSGEFGKGFDSRGNEFWFDLDDYDKIKNFYWQKFNSNYFVSTYRENGKQKTIQLHRLILDIQDYDYKSIMADHIGGSDTKFDNRKSNLRVATRRENNINIPIKKNNTSGETGVSWSETKHKWGATINDRPGHHKHLGYFDNFEDAISARKKAESEYYGEFVRRG